MRTTVSALIVFLSIVIVQPRATAQAPHAASTQADREAVLRVLQHSEVARLASQIGLDLRRATSAVAMLDGQELADLAARARRVDRALAGGQKSVTISTTMIIIGLLALILLIVALK